MTPDTPYFDNHYIRLKPGEADEIAISATRENASLVKFKLEIGGTANSRPYTVRLPKEYEVTGYPPTGFSHTYERDYSFNNCRNDDGNRWADVTNADHPSGC